MFVRKTIFVGLIAAAVGLATVGSASAGKPFGDKASIAFAAKLWSALEGAHLVGSASIHATPYKGQPPHGAVLETVDGKLTVDGRTGAVIVKKNYRGKGLSKKAVGENPDKYLRSVTVMFKREKGYDPQDKDWFWVKYAPNGSPLKNKKGMALAGRVAKGKPKGCIACHRAAPGGDFVYNNNRIAR